MINNEDRKRYHRQLIIDQWGDEVQEKLSHTRVTLIGAGALGSPAALYLAAAGIGRLKIIDKDKVELSNLNRQIIHEESLIGLPKADSAGKRLNALNSSIEIETLEAEFNNETAEAFCEDTDILVDCLDSFSVRKVLNRWAVIKKTPLVHAGISGGGGQITVVPAGGKPCLECIFPQAPDQENIPVLGAAAGILGSMEAMEVIKLISGIGKPLTRRLLICNFFTADYQEIELRYYPDCPVCGKESNRAVS
ncbi:MAG: HesA/MoeB/ThiF family protein [Spirochaetia bacterium]